MIAFDIRISFDCLGNNEEAHFHDQSDTAGESNDEHSDNILDEGGEKAKDCDISSDGEEAGEEDGAEDEDRHEASGNAGWAMAMAKILGKKTPESTTSILVKNKELDKIKESAKEEQLERKKQVTALCFRLLIMQKVNLLKFNFNRPYLKSNFDWKCSVAFGLDCGTLTIAVQY